MDENELSIKAGNIINEVLLAHKDKWDGDDEIQDMLVEAFLAGIIFERDNVDEMTNGR